MLCCLWLKHTDFIETFKGEQHCFFTLKTLACYFNIKNAANVENHKRFLFKKDRFATI